MFRRVLIGFDNSPNSSEAVRVGTELARIAGGEALLLIVVLERKGEDQESRILAFEAEASALREYARHQLEMMNGTDITYRVKVISYDEPAKAIMDYFTQHGYDLLVLGRHGQEQPTHMGLGRVVAEIISHSSFPVLVVGDGSFR